MWTKIFPELAEFASAERKDQFDAAQAVAMRKHPIASVLLIGGGAFVAFALERKLQWQSWQTYLCMFPILIVFFVWFRMTMRQYFWQELARRGKPICQGCGYNLTGNVSGVCPECATPIKQATK